MDSPDLNQVSAATEPRKPVRKRLWAAERRRQLLDVALSMLEKHGSDSLRLGDIAVTAGVTKPVVYRHFPSRQALLIAMIEDYAERFIKSYHAIFKMGTESDKQPILQLIESGFNIQETSGVLMRQLMWSIGTDSQVEAARIRMLRRMLKEPIELAMHITGLSEPDARSFVAMSFAAGGAAMDQYNAGDLSRERAIEMARRGIVVMFAEFLKDGKRL